MQTSGAMLTCCPPPPQDLQSNPTTLSVFQKCNHPNHLYQIHARLIKTNSSNNNFYISKLLSHFTQFNQMDHARLLFDHTKKPNTLICNTLIKGYLHSGLFREALLLYQQMLHNNLQPDNFTFPLVLNACAALPSFASGLSAHSLIIKSGFEANVFVQNSAIDMYCKCNNMDCARQVFDEMPERDTVSWTSIISGYSKLGEMQEAELLFGLMPEKDLVSWTAIISGFAQNDCPNEALLFFRQMQMGGVVPNEFAIVSALSACASLGFRSLGIWLHGFVNRHGLELTAFMGTALVDMYSKCGDISNAHRVFELMPKRSLASWNSMILGLAMNGSSKEALSMFLQLEKAGVEPNSITLSSVLCACTHGGLVEEGCYYFDYICREYEIFPNLDHYGCMVDLLGRAGHVEQAYELVRSMPIEPNEVVWGALLGACRIHGYLELGEYTLDRLVELDPENSGNYVLLSNMYAMLGRWKDVERLRAMMRDMGVKKTRGSSSIEVNSIVHEFCAGDKSHPLAFEIYHKLADLNYQLEALGYKPNLD